MKKYMLKKWYPSLLGDWGEGDIFEIKGDRPYYHNTRVSSNFIVSKEEVENNPDFWEEVKQPLFITDDNIKIFDDTTEIISVSIKHHTVSKWGYRYLCKPLDCENFKHFGIEANADKYIEENKPKPIFITEDGVEVFLNNVELFAVNEIFETASAINFDFDCCKKEGWKLFFHKANADEYIWKNKRVFSYNEIWKYAPYGSPLSIFEQLAKERI